MSSGAEGHERLCTMDVLHTVLDVTLVLASCLLEIVCRTSVYYIMALAHCWCKAVAPIKVDC